MRKTIVIDYVGRLLRRPASSSDTHVVVSQRDDGELEVRTTAEPLTSLSDAQRAGETHVRMTQIEDDRAVFTEVPEYDASGGELQSAARRSFALDVMVCAIVVVLAVVIALLVL